MKRFDLRGRAPPNLLSRRPASRRCPNARVMTFDYGSDATKVFEDSTNWNTFYQHAKAFLFAVDRARSEDVGPRIFSGTLDYL